MPKYEVLHSHIMTPGLSYPRGHVLTPADLKSIDIPIGFLIDNGTIGPVRGTEDDTVMNAIADGTVNPVSGGSPASHIQPGDSLPGVDGTPETLPITSTTVENAQAEATAAKRTRSGV